MEIALHTWPYTMFANNDGEKLGRLKTASPPEVSQVESPAKFKFIPGKGSSLENCRRIKNYCLLLNSSLSNFLRIVEKMAAQFLTRMGQLGLGVAVVGGVVNSALYNGKSSMGLLYRRNCIITCILFNRFIIWVWLE